MFRPKPRKYYSIWERIKKRGRAVIECDPKIFPRVKKAVIKEKYMDYSFKLINEHDYFYLQISYDREKHRATFVLKETVGIEGVRASD